MVYTQETIQALAEKLWLEYCELFPKLVKYDCPKIMLSNRLTATAGYNCSEDNIVVLGSKFITKFPERMLRETLPHELGHQIDFNLNGWFKGYRHHGPQWKAIMDKIGVWYNIYHEYGRVK